MNQIDPASIVGEIPNLKGKSIDRLVIQEFWYSGILTDEVNKVYLRIKETWHTLYFDCGVIFWRSSTEEEINSDPFIDDSEDLYEVKLRDIGKEKQMEGKVIQEMIVTAGSLDARLRFSFTDGSSLYFENIDDNTSLKVEPSDMAMPNSVEILPRS